MEITSEYVQLSVNDGTTMRAWVARPKEKGANPGLLVFQEAFGVNAHIRDIAGRFAREGFVAVAPELFHRTGAGCRNTLRRFSQRGAAHEGPERCLDGGRPARCV